MGAATFSAFNFLEGTSEQEAIDLLKELSAKKHVFCLINFDEIKTVFVQPDGFSFTEYYRPIIKIKRDYVIASRAGQRFPILF